MSWWLWVLIWVLLFVGALTVFFLLLRQVWRKLRLLFDDLSTATERLSAVSEELERLQDRTPAAEPVAVFEDPLTMRAQRFAARSKRRGSGRRTQT